LILYFFRIFKSLFIKSEFTLDFVYDWTREIKIIDDEEEYVEKIKVVDPKPPLHIDIPKDLPPPEQTNNNLLATNMNVLSLPKVDFILSTNTDSHCSIPDTIENRKDNLTSCDSDGFFIILKH
jgi:hypothetical protein